MDCITEEDARRVLALMTDRLSWVTETRLIETNWDRLQRRAFELYDPADLYHESAKLRRYQAVEVALSTEVFRQPDVVHGCTRIDRRYESSPTVKLPSPPHCGSIFSDVVLNRRSCRRFGPGPVSLPDLASILYHTCGITGRQDFTEQATGRNLTQLFRAAPSGGALYPVETYVAAVRIGDLKPALYHYHPGRHCLHRLDAVWDREQLLGLFPVHPAVVRLDEAALLLIFTGVLDRNYAKYGVRGYRYVLQETGHMCQNAWLAAVARGYGAVSVAGFYDDELNRWLGVDGCDEAALYVLAAGPAMGGGNG